MEKSGPRFRQWSEEDKKKLLLQAAAGTPVPDLAVQLGRSEVAIYFQLAHHILNMIDSGIPEEQALKSLRTPKPIFDDYRQKIAKSDQAKAAKKAGPTFPPEVVPLLTEIRDLLRVIAAAQPAPPPVAKPPEPKDPTPRPD